MKLRLDDPQMSLPEFNPGFDYAPTSSFQKVLRLLDELSGTTVEKGSIFEQLVKAFLEEDKAQSQRFDRVWFWRDWPGNRGQHDTGIDLVARERDNQELIAIQCKFYAPTTTIGLPDINSFLAAYSTTPFSGGIIVSTSRRWGRNAENALQDREKPVVRWGPEVFEKSSIDWENFSLDSPKALTSRVTKELRDYQDQALKDVLDGFANCDRGKLIMACGSGKTFTALRIAEQVAGVGGLVLFLTPSISLLSQSLIDWSNDADLPLKNLAVCSDIRAGQRRSDDEDISPFDLTEPASTDAARLAQRFSRVDRTTTMTTIFSTYQSLDVVGAAQKDGLPEFDLIICDEAHRTTGMKGMWLAGKDESSFQRIHDNTFIAGKKRLYMTATPRIYGDQARRKANENQMRLASMDDMSIYGPELHRLGFGRAIDLGILSDYKVLIFDVDQEQVGIDLHSLLSDSGTNINMDNGARMVGCWNGLRKRGAEDLDFGSDSQPAGRAVAFSNTIKQSELFKKYFPQVIESCIEAGGEEAEESPLRCEVRHVDGTQHALARAEHLAWLRAEPDDGTCRILTNARCLTEGIDVPALDAILFLHPRKSEIDVVQAVGRVMRKSEGKQFGYIILPIARAPESTPQQTVNSSAYKAVWQVINAITAHDDRFEARVNQLKLLKEDNPSKDYPGDPDIFVDVNGGNDDVQPELPILISGSEELRDAILAKVVEKYSNPRYWEDWATNIRQIAERHEARIRALLRVPDAGVRPVFDEFLASIRQNINDGVGEDEAIGILSQHLVTKPVFDALFEDFNFIGKNAVSKAMQTTIDSLQDKGLEKETEGLESFYRDVRVRAQGVETVEGRQKLIAELYERFIRMAFPEVAKSLGIVYTPTEAVGYIIRSVEDLLNREFKTSIGDKGVHILDPFVGTGTFICQLLQSGLVERSRLEHKYREELHANELVLLAYYIAAVNIELVFHEILNHREYVPFEGIVLTDTFESTENITPMDNILFPANESRISRQKELDIRVIVGNPPYSVGQRSQNDNNQNRSYPRLRRRIANTYARRSEAKLQRNLYDSYVQAIRWASDRIQDSENGGIVAFIINGGFIKGLSADGMRKAIIEEFDKVYCYNLRGDQRTTGEKSKKERGKIFGSGSRASVAMLFLVKNSKRKSRSRGEAELYYCDIGDNLEREEKLLILDNSRLADTEWERIIPNVYGDWVDQRTDDYKNLFPLFGDGGIFLLDSLGILTGRDAWCFNFSKTKLAKNVQSMMEFFNQQSPTDNPDMDATKFSWTRSSLRKVKKGDKLKYQIDKIVTSGYRPFCKQNAYFCRTANEVIYRQEQIFPTPEKNNVGIEISEKDKNSLLSCLMKETLSNHDALGVHTKFLPRWTFVHHPENELGVRTQELWERKSNINPEALGNLRDRFQDETITDDDLFYYVYGVLHHEGYRKEYANDLSKEPARVPLASSLEDFKRFAEAGRELADLHVNYENVQPYPLQEVYAKGWDADAEDAYDVRKMTCAAEQPRDDKARIVYNAGITLEGIPEKAHQYVLGSRSALDWIIERYQVRTEKESGISNDPNDWARETGNPRYILDLVKRITTVSVRTVDIVANLPDLPL